VAQVDPSTGMPRVVDHESVRKAREKKMASMGYVQGSDSGTVPAASATVVLLEDLDAE
jgi:hypothetical protein